ncbi:phenylacetate--CoA ligase family protein [Enterocloster aldenensis]|uniref:phenylacetate--CoA ligase family protein n=1 Tax=Enterocloster aldenensis TaxID=358742 RepID=UPI00402635AC
MNLYRLFLEFYKTKKQVSLSRTEMKKLQSEKLQSILRYAYENSPYYRRSFEEAGITAENIGDSPLSSFPTIDKQTLLHRFDEIVTVSDLKQQALREYDAMETMDASPYLGKYHVVHSSGSTGQPGYFVYDNKAWDTMLLGIIRAALWDMSMPEILMFLAKRPRVLYVAATDGRYGGVMAVGDGIKGVGAKQLRLDINAPLEEWVKKIREFQPNLVIGYPSAIKILGELTTTHGLPLKLSRIITCGEPLCASMRNYFENAFHTKVFNFYGSSESLAMGVEADRSEGMLLFDDFNVYEVMNGKLYLTSLYNFAQPLIRYEINDAFTLQEPEPEEKYPFTKAKGLLGRSEDIMWFEQEDGRRDFLHPLAVEGFCIEGLIDYQFVQTGKDSFKMTAELGEGADGDRVLAEVTGQMKGILSEKRLDFVRFTVSRVDAIHPDPKSGKKKLILNNNGSQRA